MDRCDHHICSIYLCFACDNILDLCPFCIRQIRHINDHICGFFGKTYHRILKAFAGKQSLNCNLLFGALLCRCHRRALARCGRGHRWSTMAPRRSATYLVTVITTLS